MTDLSESADASNAKALSDASTISDIRVVDAFHSINAIRAKLHAVIAMTAVATVVVIGVTVLFYMEFSILRDEILTNRSVGQAMTDKLDQILEKMK